MFSGKDGKRLFEFSGAASGDWFGMAVAAAGDVNRDGYPDVAVGAPQGEYDGKGYVRVLSGKDGKVLHEVAGRTGGDRFGTAVAGVGDVNRDGYPDLVAGATQDGNGGRGYVLLLSGRDGKILRELTGAARRDAFGCSVSGAPDLDTDGCPDLVVGARGNDRKGLDAGAVQVFSGRNGKVLHVFYGQAARDRFGESVAAAGGPAGEVYLLAGAPQLTAAGKGYVRVLAGRSGKTLMTLVGAAARDHLGWTGAAGDVDRDGHPDFVLGAPQYDPAFQVSYGPGQVRVFSSKKLSLATERHVVSLAAGGAQTFHLDAGPEQGGRLCLVLGTMSGTEVRWKLGKVVLPLNPFDSYFGLTLANPNRVIEHSLAVMAAGGKGTARLVLPPRLPAVLAGTTLDHAYVVFRAEPLRFDFASNPVPLTLVK